MPITDAQRDLMLARMRDVWKEVTCEICRTTPTPWVVADTLYEVKEFHPDGRTASVVPFVTVTCHHCGNTKHFNAIVLGLIDKQTGRWTI